MMMGETQRYHHHGPPWPEPTSPTMITYSSSIPDVGTPPSPAATSYASVLASLRQYVLSASDQNKSPVAAASPDDDFPADDDDDFFMYEFKVRKCTRARAHDWTECPFAHPGEKARRRDPRKYSYSGTACSEFRKGGCKKGDACEFAHGVFECWLHPSRYRTQACKDGSGCRRRVCFFAHSHDQLRAGPGLMGTSPRSPHSSVTDFGDDGLMSSASLGMGLGSGSVGELAASLRNLQLNKVKSMPSSWAGGGVQIGSPVFGSPRTQVARPGFFSLPTTPTRPGIGYWDKEEEPVLERVESGRELRARMFEKLSKDNPLNGPVRVEIPGSGLGPDLGWVSDLIT